MNKQLSYRPEIDGLRAIAVLSVILFHAGFSWISGGFVGVDIFFVISGYLITRILLKELDAGTFSFKEFWLRRTRRILPALLFVMCASFVIFYGIFPPDFYKNLAYTAASQTFFVSNVFLGLQGGYFAEASTTYPLLHTWSLSVEEQFYLITPVVLFMLYKYAKPYTLPVFALGILCSFVLSVMRTPEHPSESFYLIHTRAWELGVGSLLAFYIRAYPQALANKPYAKEALSITGFTLILFSLFTFTGKLDFPYYWALIPCLGTALIIATNHHNKTLVGKFLSSKTFVFIGLISYSLYLWHWIIITYIINAQIEEPSIYQQWLMVLLGIPLAWLTYKFIETPFRQKVTSNKKLVVGLLCGFSFVLIFTYVVKTTNGMFFRLDSHTIESYERAKELTEKNADCLSKYEKDKENFICIENAHLGQPRILLWGDSHASALHPAFDEASHNTQTPYALAALAACPPVWNLYNLSQYKTHLCKPFNERVLKYIETHNIHTIVLHSVFQNYVHGWPKTEYRQPYLSEKYEDPTSPEESFATFKKQLKSMVAHLNTLGVRIYVIEQFPSMRTHIPTRLLKSALLNKDADYAEKRDWFDARQESLNKLFNDLNIKTISFTDYFCDNTYCHGIRNGHVLHKDYHHISNKAAEDLSPNVTELFKQIKSDIKQQ